jgi:Protein of unknown function (DUF2800)
MQSKSSKANGRPEHAKLSASGSAKWLSCSASARLESAFPNTSSTYADEGTLAHKFAEFELRYWRDEITEGRYNEALQRLRKHELYTSEMEPEVSKYVEYVKEQFAIALQEDEDAKIFFETVLDFSEFVPEGFGTVDVLIVGSYILKVIDLKYGKGVAVDVTDNSQLKLYALGACEKYGFVYDFDEIDLAIIQPRLNSFSEWRTYFNDLYLWANETVKPAAQKAINGEGDPVAGTHCKWCRAKPTCRAFANYAQEITALEFAEPETLNDEEVVKAFETIPLISEWLKAVSEYMHREAKNGRKFPGYKLVQVQGKRRWKDESAILTTLGKAGFNMSGFVNTKLKGIGDVANLVTVDFFEKNLQKFIVKGEGAPALVPDSDKRPAIETDLKELFKDGAE